MSDTQPKKRGPFLQQLRDEMTLWHTPDHTAYADLVRGDKQLSVAIKSQMFKAHIYWRAAQNSLFPSETTINDYIANLHGLAMTGPVFTPSVRVGKEAGEIFYDLAAEDGSAVSFSEGSWKLVGSPPMRFVRGAGTMAQVSPAATGEHLYDLLGQLIHAPRREIVLMAAWLIAAMKPGGPYPVLIINGEQGSAKSTTSRMLARIIDPHSRDLREPPSNARDFVAAVRNSYVLAFDNVSRVPHWFSDTLCRLATGTGAIGGRQLYTDNDEIAFMAVRPVLLNGIPSFVERPDLSDRTLNVSLPEIGPERRRDDDTVWAAFDAAKPRILGSLFNLVARAHRDFDGTIIADPPRMAGVARWVAAALGEDSAEFLAILAEDRRHAAEENLEHDHVAQGLIDYLNQHVAGYVGTVQGFLNALHIYAPRNKDFWPQTSLQLMNALRRVSPVLRRAGIIWQRTGREGGTGRSLISIRRAENFAEMGFAVSAAAGKGAA